MQITFTITESEIEESAWRKLSKIELLKVLSYIESDESIWNAIEDSKREALLNLAQG
ncbi:MAG: hypothetical protein ACD_2C00141G0011 [uncultured bacterium (gcode 4)]|uniref:Uncharacterized protein n=1 Tax=uncultured bacterium (gcode 4) TaxID=1234023 RepID=K2GGP3_9BACT|nr:MAG: hypothetical protein ACD_2C00141G0011 [uncultured bacterium (gcode 4)]